MPATDNSRWSTQEQNKCVCVCACVRRVLLTMLRMRNTPDSSCTLLSQVIYQLEGQLELGRHSESGQPGEIARWLQFGWTLFLRLAEHPAGNPGLFGQVAMWSCPLRGWMCGFSAVKTTLPERITVTWIAWLRFQMTMFLWQTGAFLLPCLLIISKECRSTPVHIRFVHDSTDQPTW